MKETLETFISQHKVAIVDSAFIAGYILFIIAATILILFFGLRYIRRHQKPDEKTVKGFTKQSLLDMFDIFMLTVFFYIGHVMGIKTGLYKELAPLFDMLPPFLYSLVFIPVLLSGFFGSFFIYDKFLGGKVIKGTFYLYDRMKKRGHLYDDTEDTDIPDIPDSDTGGGVPGRPIHHDRHCP